MKILQIFLLIFLQSSLDASKILILSQQPYLTNQKVASNLADDLASRGHYVTIFTSTYVGKYHKNVKEFNFDGISLPKVARNSHKGWLEMYHDLTRLHYEFSRNHIKHPVIQQILQKQKKFDLLIIDCVICHLLSIAEIQSIPAIYLSPNEPLNFINEQFGNEVNPSLHPETHTIGYKHGQLSLYQRLNSYLSFHYWKFLGGLHHCMLMRQALDPVVNLTCQQLLDRLDFLLIHTHPAFGNVRPLVPKTVQFGFSYAERAEKVVDKGLLKFLDRSRHGAIIFAVDGLKVNELRVFLSALKELKQTVVLTIENATNSVDESIYAVRNAQLKDVIAHENVKLVVSTADYREVELLLKNRLPMLLVPLTHEEMVNARLMVDRKVARQLDVTRIVENQVIAAVNEMISNENVYRENLRKLEAFASDRPKLKELAPWHVEFVIRHKGARHLDYPGRLVPYYQKIFLDVYLLFLVGFVIGCKLLQVSLKVKAVVFEKVRMTVVTTVEVIQEIYEKVERKKSVKEAEKKKEK